jgi:hypothetical protein
VGQPQKSPADWTEPKDVHLISVSQGFCAVIDCGKESYGWVDLFQKDPGGIVRTYFCEHHHKVVSKCASEYSQEMEREGVDKNGGRHIQGVVALPMEEAIRAVRLEGLE